MTTSSALKCNLPADVVKLGLAVFDLVSHGCHVITVLLGRQFYTTLLRHYVWCGGG